MADQKLKLQTYTMANISYTNQAELQKRL